MNYVFGIVDSIIVAFVTYIMFSGFSQEWKLLAIIILTSVIILESVLVSKKYIRILKE